MKTLIILGGIFEEEYVTSFLKQNTYDHILAVDYGEQYAIRLGLAPDILVGDFDTRGTDGLAEYESRGVRILRSIPQKDETDSEMAIRECIRMGSDCDILCGTGGRLDHLLGTIHNMKLALDAGLKARLVDSQNIIWLERKDFTIRKKECPHPYISFIPLAGDVEGLRLTGFRYNTYDYTLQAGASRCVSNELESEKAQVAFRTGVLIVMNTGDVR